MIVTKGSYTIIEKDGTMTVVNYTADENGFHPEISEFFKVEQMKTKWNNVFYFFSLSVPGVKAGK